MLNVMPITPPIMPQLNTQFITLNNMINIVGLQTVIL